MQPSNPQTPLRTCRSKQNRTQREVAEALGLDQGHYSRIERGDVRPSPDIARRIAEFLQDEVSPMEIMDPSFYITQKAS